ncbi:MAG: glutaredoxin 3 [Hyphomicrobiaceae bacterium]
MQKIIIYTTMLCSYCRSAKRLLKAKGVAYNEIDVSGDRQKRAEMIKKSGGRRTVPQIWIGDIHVGGCDELYVLEESGKLDSMLTDAGIETSS